ncbi:hypothetical protein K8090_12850 [Halomonas meridiana]|uniref:hypothetical protein n=1 Tax=Vreelandella aquamarina TaxID=77097 RepID=UPI001E3A2F1A|nr:MULTISPECIES: hypothetical protein [Halomonas]MCD1651801.1 hypothetical protein [Halomonas axialensis]MCD2088620.1 hypothetical protein [Halomonas meridiana]
MTMKTATLTDAQWADIMQLVGRGESDLAEYVPHHAGKDGYAPEEIDDLERLLKGEASAALSKQLADDTDASSEAPATRTYTAFCQESNGTGTVWISSIEVDAQEDQDKELVAAEEQARYECARDWDRLTDPDDEDSPLDISGIVCMGLADGEVNIAMWDDSHFE